MGKKPKSGKREKSKPAKSEVGEQEKPKLVRFELPPDPTNEEMQALVN